MSTLKELVEEHGFGVKFECRIGRDDDYCWFIPYYEIEDSCFGPSINSKVANFRHDMKGWQLYKKPKKKVKMWKWLWKENCGSISETHCFYESEHGALQEYASIIQRLDYTEIEVEV